MRYMLLLTSASVAFCASFAFATESENTTQSAETVAQVKAVENAQTIEAAIIGAYKNNPDLQQRRHAVLASHEQYVQATAGWRPTVDASGSITEAKKIASGTTKDTSSAPGSSGATTNTRQGALTLSQNLYQGGMTVAAVSKADQSVRASWASLQSAEQDTLFKAVKAFLDLLSQYAQVELYKASKTAFQKEYEAAVEKRNIGEETQTQVANAEAKLANAEATLRSAEAQLEGLKATYTQITGIQPAVQLKKPEPPAGLLPADLQSAVQLAKDQHPDIITAQFEHLAAQSDTQRIGGGLLPTVNMEASTSRNETRGRYEVANTAKDSHANDMYTNNQVMLQVKIPLYEGGAIRSQKRQAHETAVQKRVAIENARTQVVQLVIQSWQNYQAAKNNIENYQKQVRASEVSLEGTKQEMAVGSKILLDVLNARAALLEAQLKLVQAEQAYILEAYRLMSAVGLLNAKYLKLPIEHFNPELHYQMTSGRF
jgi:outer membrane protein